MQPGTNSKERHIKYGKRVFKLTYYKREKVGG